MPSRQTYSYLRDLFAKRGIAPQHRHGQNFLIDLNLHELIARSAELSPDDIVLEVGPGAGALTALLAQSVAAVVAVDIDPAMAALTKEATAGLPNVRVINTDALAGKHRLDPTVVDTLRSAIAAGPDRPLKLVANLPFNVATPLLSNLLTHPEFQFTKLVVTIQRELAERLLAAPATDAYGALSIVVQALADVELVRVLPPSVFWPRPKVDSAIVTITARPENRAAIADLPWFQAVVRRVFQHRRKHLRGILASAWGSAWSKADADALLESQGLDGQLRPEALDVPEWVALTDALKQRLGNDVVRETIAAAGLRD